MVSLLQPIRIFGVLYRSPFLRVGSGLIVSAFPASVITTSTYFFCFSVLRKNFTLSSRALPFLRPILFLELLACSPRNWNGGAGTPDHKGPLVAGDYLLHFLKDL